METPTYQICTSDRKFKIFLEHEIVLINCDSNWYHKQFVTYLSFKPSDTIK